MRRRHRESRCAVYPTSLGQSCTASVVFLNCPAMLGRLSHFIVPDHISASYSRPALFLPLFLLPAPAPQRRGCLSVLIFLVPVPAPHCSYLSFCSLLLSHCVPDPISVSCTCPTAQGLSVNPSPHGWGTAFIPRRLYGVCLPLDISCFAVIKPPSAPPCRSTLMCAESVLARSPLLRNAGA